MIPRDQNGLAVLEASKRILIEIQNFDIAQLVREKELGELQNFKGAVVPAESLVGLYRNIGAEILEDIPTNLLQSHFQQYGQQILDMFNQIMSFQPAQGPGVRDQLINGLNNHYTTVFNALHPIIAFSNTRAIDLGRIDRDARETVDRVKQRAAEVEKSVKDQLEKVNEILETVRKVAAEQGVTQQAIYFKDEANLHKSESVIWQSRTIKAAIALGIWAAISLILSKWDWLRSQDLYQHIQLMVSKVMIFAVFSFMLYLAARNYSAHQHNEVVNRHRQNALLTFEAFVKASGDPELGKAILGQAAACIFSPQATGYSSEPGIDAAKASSVVEVLAKPLVGAKS